MTCCTGEGVGEFSLLVSVNCYKLYKEKFGIKLSKLQIYLLFKEAVPLLGLYPVGTCYNCNLSLIAKICNNFNVHQREIK